MGEVKHTPGPWVATRHPRENARWFVQADGATGPLDVCEISKMSAGIKAATARLIAAAPDYDAAARDFVEPYAEVTDAQLRHAAAGNPASAIGTRVTVTVHPEIAAAVLRFRAAIAKAEGQS